MGRAGTGAAVLDGQTGYRVDGNELTSIGATLARLLGDKTLAKQLGEAGYQRSRSDFSWVSVAEKTQKLFDNRL